MNDLNLIQEKINNGEGYIEMQNAGIIKVSEMNSKDNIIKVFTKYDYKIINNELVLKTKEDFENEEKLKTQQEILNKLKPLMDAMTFQEISKSKGAKPENVIFEDADIKKWGDYVSEIAKGNLEINQPEISENIKKLIGL
jgi:hypothetical protein